MSLGIFNIWVIFRKIIGDKNHGLSQHFFNRIADSHHVTADPDPDFDVIADPDPAFNFNPDPDLHHSNGTVRPLVYC